MRVAFLGLGIMGRSMAANLVKAGHEVAVWNRTAGKEVEGARSAASPAEAAQGAEVVWICVSDTRAVDDVLFGPGGVAQVLAAGMTIADSSTISPSATRRFAEHYSLGPIRVNVGGNNHCGNSVLRINDFCNHHRAGVDWKSVIIHATGR